MSAKDRGILDVNSLLTVDSGFDDYSTKAVRSTTSRDILYEREIITTRPLDAEQKTSLLQQVTAKAAQQLRPGVAVTLVTFEAEPCKHLFLVTVQ